MPAAKKYEAIHVENEGGITWLMINRPDKRNAMSPQVHLEMDETLDELAVDPATEVLVLTGAGNAFSAGQDIKLYFRANAGDAAARYKLRRASNNWRWQKLSTFPKPTIAMVNGYCFGGALHPGDRLRYRARRRRRHVRPVGGQLGHPARRHRVVERGADA